MSKLCIIRRGAAAFVTVCGLSVLALPATAGADAKSAAGPMVKTSAGPVRGFVKSGTNTFLGIPYAEPPVGRLRWRPPEPHAAWRKPLDATAFGPSCAQVTTLGVFAGPTSINEDCLYLNVFTTRGHHRRSARFTTGGHHRRSALFTTGGHHRRSARKPVLVWIHGGGNVDGSSSDYDGSKLANGGRYGGKDTVVVTVNYRLGLLGFLAHPALDSEGHAFGNYGTMDIQAALRWVQRNIARFGGDPDNVTLGGQSAGASETGANVISPLSAGLFQRAIFQSKFTSTYAPLSVGLTRGNGFAQAARCPGDGASAAACLRNLSVPEILQLQGTANSNGPYVTGQMVDGTVIPITPEQAWSTGRFNQMPIMGGNTHDERTFSSGITEYFSGPPQEPVSAEDYTASVTQAYSGNAGPGNTPPAYPPGTVEKVLAEYPLSSYASPFLADDAAFTDPGACRGLHVSNLLSKSVPVYSYQFDYRDAPYYFPEMPGFDPLAAHTIDIQFLFPLWHGGELGVPHPLNDAETKLSNELVAAWTNFAASGNPNGSGDTPWHRYVAGNGPYYSENIPGSSTVSADQFAAQHHCDFWDSILVYESTP
jgi:para-nitrobenzyl esterase